MVTSTTYDSGDIAVHDREPNEGEKPDVVAEQVVGDHGAHQQAEEAGLMREPDPVMELDSADALGARE